MSFNNDREFDAESYVKVNVRLLEFWTKYPKGRLETEVTVVNNTGLIVKAKLYRDDSEKPLATGHSFLDDVAGDKVGEYTETVAVGRALALAGFSVEKSIASAQEMQRFKDKQDKKTANTDPQPRSSSKIQRAPQAPVAPSAKENLADTPPVEKPAALAAAPTQAEPPKEMTGTPDVPKTLKTSRIFKPPVKTAQT